MPRTHEAQRIPVNELFRNIDQYEGEYVRYGDLFVSDVVSNEGTKKYILGVRGGRIGDDRFLWGIWDGNPFKRMDDVRVWGVVRGLQTYESLGGNKTVPKIRIVDMELREG